MSKSKYQNKTREDYEMVRDEVDSVCFEIKDENYSIYPSAREWLRTSLYKGKMAGTVQSREQVQVVTKALLSAAVEVTPRKSIRVKDLTIGWAKHLALKDCPPHECFFRSVLSRVDELSEALPLFDKLLKR